MVRVSTSPSFGVGTGDSTSSKSLGFGIPTGRLRSTIWRFTDVGMAGLPGSVLGSARVVAPAVLAGDRVEAGFPPRVDGLLGRGQDVAHARERVPNGPRGGKGAGRAG